MADKDEHWIHTFVRNNAWAILGLLVFISVFYANTINRVSALEENLSVIKETMLGITNNQTQILLIQQRQAITDVTLQEIKLDVKEIKSQLQVHRESE